MERPWTKVPVTITLPPEKILNKDLLDQVLSREKPAVLIIWDDYKALPALESIAEDKRRPELVFVSSRYMGNSIWTLKEQIRDYTYITYPFSFSPVVPPASMEQKAPSDLKMTLRQADIPLKDNTKKIMQLTNYADPSVDFLVNGYEWQLLPRLPPGRYRHHDGPTVSTIWASQFWSRPAIRFKRLLYSSAFQRR